MKMAKIDKVTTVGEVKEKALKDVINELQNMIANINYESNCVMYNASTWKEREYLNSKIQVLDMAVNFLNR